MPLDLKDRIRGVLLGTAVGDSLGLPAEGMSRRRVARLYGGRWSHRLLPAGRGMLSDDTEHTILVAQSLIEAPESAELFTSLLASRLKLWLLLLPAGVGFATLRSILRLLIGISPEKSGVRSAGNGPAMRSAPIGAFFHNNPPMLEKYVTASTSITHTDERALAGARAVALCVAWSIKEEPKEKPPLDDFCRLLLSAGEDPRWRDIVEKLGRSLEEDLTVGEFANLLGASKGISGYVYSTVPVALYAWYRHFGDFEKTLSMVLDCGGDTDTAGAIAGAMAGAVTGESGIPAGWIEGIADWPSGISYIGKLADNLAGVMDGSRSGPAVSYFRAGLLPRNLFFLGVVLLHGLRRLLPPY